MKFNNYRVNISIRIFVLALTIYLMVNLVYNHPMALTQWIVLFLLGVQIISLFRYLDNMHKEMTTLLNAIPDEDVHYPEDTGSSLDFLYKEFNKVAHKMRKEKVEKDEQYYYLRNIVKHLGIGLVTFNRLGEVQIINTAAKRLFDVQHMGSIDELKSLSPLLVETFYNLKTGGSDLVKIEKKGEIIQLSVYAIELTLRGEVYKLVSLQNIQNELEEKEMEAWQNLIRVLTHEIMNSVTPISSLAASVDRELLSHIHEGEEKCAISTDDMQDIHMAVQTIQKRSEGLIRFVTDFRNLTKIPVPKLHTVPVQDIFNRVRVLLKHDLQAAKVILEIDIEPKGLAINADQELIEQVLINLVKNAIHALEERENERRICLSAYTEPKNKVIVKVVDNGCGIEEEALKKIFIPFFTTKQHGSGIGLSISRQIMRQHKGTISVKSVIDEGTTFFLKF
jgi:two-component system nitrogen regulation sensor histidine kinase NtrY